MKNILFRDLKLFFFFLREHDKSGHVMVVRVCNVES